MSKAWAEVRVGWAADRGGEFRSDRGGLVSKAWSAEVWVEWAADRGGEFRLDRGGLVSKAWAEVRAE
ncbi:hypothetical protein [Amycolatopsis sp. cmx-8-4]|uniref:hypothetical protein n=1 Tax=Amycolatopsis sp. cmx-8-4 TaxID=2790947 RepID=UPI00397B188D